MPADHLTEAVERVAALVPARAPGDRPFVVAVDGRSGSGKTTFAGALAARLGAALVHLDDVYPGWDGLEAGVHAVATGVLAPLRAGRPGAYPTWDWVRDEVGPTVRVVPSPVLVVEGVGAAAGPAAGLVDLLVWLEAPDALRRARAVGRDGEVFAREWDRWAAQEAALGVRDDRRARADVLLDTSGWQDAEATA